MGAFVLRKLASVFLAVLVAAAAPSCSGVPRAAQSSTLASSAAWPVSSLPDDSEKTATSTPESSSAPQQDGEVSVSGRDNNVQFSNLEFLNDQVGWVIDSGRTHSQLLTTKDGGATWNPVGHDDRTLSAVRFVSESEGWAVAEDDGGAAIVTADTKKQYQVLHTTDGGASWKLQWQGGSQPNRKPALYVQSSKIGYALLGNSLLKTEDGGKTWTSVRFGVQNFVLVGVFFSGSGTGWAAGVSTKKDTLSVLCTSDGGKSWSVQFRKNYDQGSAGFVAFNFLSEKEGWFLTSDSGNWNGGLYHTEDGGDHWSLSNTVRCFRPYAEDICFTDSKTGWIPFSVGAGPVDGGLSCTRDGGKTFRVLGETSAEGGGPRAITSAKQVLFLSSKTGWAIGEDLSHGDYLLSTKDGGNTWEQRYPSSGPVTAISFVSGETGFGLGELSDENALLTTRDGGQSWQKLTSFAGKYWPEGISFLSPSEGWVLALPADSGDGSSQMVLHTSDGGKTWSRRGSFLSYGQSVYFRFFDAENGVAVQASAKWQAFRTQDGGKTWNPISCNFPNGALPDQAELSRLSGNPAKWNGYPETMGTPGGTAAALLPNGTGMVLTETSSGRVELLMTPDHGITWNRRFLPEEISEDTFDTSRGQCPMQITEDGHGWVLTDHGIMVTNDGGNTWNWQK